MELAVAFSSLAILVAAVFWTTLWGPAGLILSTPLTVCVVVLGRYVPHLDFLNVLLGDEPVLAPESQRFYKQDFDEPFQVVSRAVMFGFNTNGDSSRMEPRFMIIRFPERMAAAIRFQPVSE
jgi:hypothetical protein